jgi:hypothetical protein
MRIKPGEHDEDEKVEKLGMVAVTTRYRREDTWSRKVVVPLR